MNNKKFHRFLLAFVLPIVFLAGCAKDNCTETITYMGHVPEYMSYADLRAAVKSLPAQDLKKPGKIYFKGDFIYVNELNKGIHVIDNSNPAAPQNIAFINIPGNVDIAIRGNILLADSYIDLVAINITDPHNATVEKRIEWVFPYQREYYYAGIDTTLGVIANWREEKITETRNCNDYGYMEDGLKGGTSPNVSTNFSGTNSNTRTGIAGSMARFAIVDTWLYALDHSSMHLFDINSPANPSKVNAVNIGFNIETIFPYNNKLFIGSQTGMYIYDISTRTNPVRLSVYDHIRNCDPVVVEGDYAYVTIRSGTNCGGVDNVLEVVKISNPSAPVLQKSYPMTNPHGLGIEDKRLFVCDGAAGLKIYDASNPNTIDQNMLAHFPGMSTFDVIPLGDILLMIATDGLYQYSITSNNQISLLSKIAVKP